VKKIVVIGGGNIGWSAALLHTLAASSVESVIVEPITDWSDPSGDIIGDINNAMIDLQRNPSPALLRLEITDRRYMVHDVEITEPKQPNFSRFQNNFKRRGNN